MIDNHVCVYQFVEKRDGAYLYRCIYCGNVKVFPESPESAILDVLYNSTYIAPADKLTDYEKAKLVNAIYDKERNEYQIPINQNLWLIDYIDASQKQ